MRLDPRYLGHLFPHALLAGCSQRGIELMRCPPFVVVRRKDNERSWLPGWYVG